jgi:arginase
MPDTDVVLCDARNLDPEEAELLAASQVARVASIHEAVAALPPDRPVYVHIDVDVVNGDELSKTLYPVPGGPSKADVSRALARLRDTHDVVAVSMTSWSPALDTTGADAEFCLGLLDIVTARPVGRAAL